MFGRAPPHLWLRLFQRSSTKLFCSRSYFLLKTEKSEPFSGNPLQMSLSQGALANTPLVGFIAIVTEVGRNYN